MSALTMLGKSAAALAAIAALAAASAASSGPPPVIKSGQIAWKQTWIVDFDTGTSSNHGDVWFEAVNWSQMDLRPQGKAQISTAMYTNAQGAPPAGYPFCAHANYGTGPQPVTTPAIKGAFFCVKTNGGHVA